MTRPTFIDQGQGAYHKADAQLGVVAPPRGATPLGWLGGGPMPSLWFLARLQLGLALMTFCVQGVMQTMSAIALFDTSMGSSKLLGFQALLGVLALGTAPAVLLAGAALTSYLASRQDRERQSDLANAHAGDGLPGASSGLRADHDIGTTGQAAPNESKA